MSRFIYDQPKGFFATVKVIKNILFQEGLTSTFKKIIKHVFYKIKGVDFDFQSLDNLTIHGENKCFGTLCGSSNERTVKHLFDSLVKLDTSILDGTFVDIGSGKGKLIIHAKEYGFSHTVGVEFAKELYETSLYNINALNLKGIEVFHQDAVEFRLPLQTRIIYFLNPFEVEVFHKVLPKFIEQMKIFNQSIYLVYRVPIYKEVFENYPELKHIHSENFRGDASEVYCFSNPLSF